MVSLEKAFLGNRKLKKYWEKSSKRKLGAAKLEIK